MTALHLPADLGAPRTARRWLADGLVPHDVTDDVHFAAELLVSELVANAVIHARSAVTVALVLTAGALRVEVSDDDPRCPVVREAADAAVDGRGLWIMATVAARWGVDGRADGKTIWFELAR